MTTGAQVFSKLHCIRFAARHRVLQRLEDLRLRPPPQVQIIEQWSILRESENVDSDAGFILTTQQPLLPWPSLADVSGSDRSVQRLLVGQLETLIARWRAVDFIHGDLSPSNLLVRNDGSLVAVDWVLDLESREGTPRYVPQALAWKKKCRAHDETAARLIVDELHRNIF